MNENDIIEKFRLKLKVNEDTYRLGINIKLTDYLAKKYKDKIVLETCTGGGFTTISLAKYAKHVFTFEIDKKRINDAKVNCKFAGIENKVTFYNKDIFEINNMNICDQIEAALLDPDWNNLIDTYQFRFKNSMTQPASDKLLEEIMKITKNITLIQPPYIKKEEFCDLESYEFEKLYINNELVLYCLHFGSIKRIVGESEFRV